MSKERGTGKTIRANRELTDYARQVRDAISAKDRQMGALVGVECPSCGEWHYDQFKDCERADCPFWRDKEPA